MSLGLPDPTIKEPTFCERTVTFYLTHYQVTRSVKYCACCPLAVTLVRNQFMLSVTKVPETAIHFGLLDHYYNFKMEGYVSNHTLVDIYNKNEFYHPDPSLFRPMNTNFFNTLFWLYHRIVHHATGLVEREFDLSPERGCFACS